MTQVRWEVWRRLYALADDPVRQKLDEQYARIEEFYAEVTKMPVSLDWSHENFNAYNPCRHSERASLTARALATLEEIRLVTVQWNIEPLVRTPFTVISLKQWALGVLSYLSPGSKGFAKLEIPSSLVETYVDRWADIR